MKCSVDGTSGKFAAGVGANGWDDADVHGPALIAKSHVVLMACYWRLYAM
jgi:hypothetical protein